MTVAELIAALQTMPLDAEAVTLGERWELHAARVRLLPVRAKSSYGTYYMPPDAQHAEGWVPDLSVVLIS